MLRRKIAPIRTNSQLSGKKVYIRWPVWIEMPIEMKPGSSMGMTCNTKRSADFAVIQWLGVGWDDGCIGKAEEEDTLGELVTPV